MRKYIVDLTSDLISKNNFCKDYDWLKGDREKFVKYVTLTLFMGSVGKMNPSTLGKIMGEIEDGEICISQAEIFEEARFTGDCKGFLVSIVSVCLASLIFDRIDGKTIPTIPVWIRRDKPVPSPE